MDDEEDLCPSTYVTRHDTGTRKGHDFATQNLSEFKRDNIAQEGDEYCFSHARRGIAVIIVNDKVQEQEQRAGCRIDMQHFQKTFNHLGFEIRTYFDVTTKQLLKELTAVSEEDHSDADCFALAISSHGEQIFSNNCRDDVIWTCDDTIKTKDIMNMFSDKACPSLRNKPRLFFIQACRGCELDPGLELELKKAKGNDVPDSRTPNQLSKAPPPGAVGRSHDVSDAMVSAMECQESFTPSSRKYKISQQENLGLSLKSMHITTRGNPIVQEQTQSKEPMPVHTPCCNDFLVMYASPPGYFAFRRPSEGSWFVKSFADILLKSDGKRSLTQELTRVMGMVAAYASNSPSNPGIHEKKQIPVMYSMLTKDIYLKPRSR